MHYRFRWVYCFRQEEFAKIYFFLPTTAHRNYLQKMHFVFSQTYESNLPFCFCLSREYWSRGSIRVDARAQAPRCQDPRGDSSLDRAGRALRALNHRRTAGPSIAMPRARSVGQSSSVRALGAPHSYGSARTPIMQLRRPRFAFSSTPWHTSRQFYADAGDAENRETVVGNQPTGEADQDRRQGGQPRPLRYVSDGRGRGAPADVPGNFVAYRPVAGAARASVTGRLGQIWYSDLTDHNGRGAP